MSKRKTHKEFLEEIFDLVGNEYDVIGNYVNAHTELEIKHNLCGTIYPITPTRFLHRGRRCSECFSKKRKTHEEFIREVRVLVKNEYDILGSYFNAETPVEIIHNLCGHRYIVRPTHFLYGKRCPKCSSSKGEQKILSYLTDNNIIHHHQFSFEDCIDKEPLRFDFAVTSGSGELTFLIEYDGRQHFEPIEYFGGIQGFLNRIRRDKIKNQYCLDHSISLIRIPYFELDNIDDILDHIILNKNNGINVGNFIVSENAL